MARIVQMGDAIISSLILVSLGIVHERAQALRRLAYLLKACALSWTILDVRPPTAFHGPHSTDG